jgi:uncharacterized protein (TIGR03086 family)
MAMLDLEPAAREVSHVLDGVTDDMLTDPTPCTGTSVAAMLDHMMGFTLAFTWAARKTNTSASGPSKANADHLDPNWRTLLPQQLDELAEAWRDPSAWEGMTQAGGLTMPAPTTATVALDELVMHGWDLARATGQQFTCDPASAEAVLAFASATAAPENAGSREGLFGPVVEVPEDASTFDRALGFAGRDPDWTPAST